MAGRDLGFAGLPNRGISEPRWRGGTVPYAVVRLADESVIGSTRFHQLDYWPWPDRGQGAGPFPPDVCEIGWTWLTETAARIGCTFEGCYARTG